MYLCIYIYVNVWIYSLYHFCLYAYNQLFILQPLELATPAEQKVMIAKRAEMLKFFSEMEENIKKKIERTTEVIPDSERPLFVDSEDSSTRGDDEDDHYETSSSHHHRNIDTTAEQFYTLDEKDNMTLVVDENSGCTCLKSSASNGGHRAATTTLKSSSVHFGSASSDTFGGCGGGGGGGLYLSSSSSSSSNSCGGTMHRFRTISTMDGKHFQAQIVVGQGDIGSMVEVEKTEQQQFKWMGIWNIMYGARGLVSLEGSQRWQYIRVFPIIPVLLLLPFKYVCMYVFVQMRFY